MQVNFPKNAADQAQPARAPLPLEQRRLGNLTWRIRPDLATAELLRLLEDVDGFLASQARIFKDDPSATVGAAAGFVIKRSIQRKRRNLVIDLFRRSRARRAFSKALELERMGIATARAVATADVRTLGLAGNSYLVMEEIPSAIHLGRWRGDKLQTIRSVATLLARLHNAGFRHGDLKETNILFDPSGRPHLIDLDAVRRFRTGLPERAALNDLARLWRVRLKTHRYWRTDALRFLKAYCSQRNLPNLRSYWEKIASRPPGR